MKKNIYLALMLVVTLSAVDVLGVETMSLGTLEKFIQDGMANNPKIQQAYNQWQAAEYKIKVVKSLEDPMVSYGYFGEEVQTRVGPQEQKYDISQRVPFPGKRRLKEKAQEKHARMLEEKYEAVKVAIITEIKLNYYDLFWIDQAIEINEEEKSILVRLEKVAQRKYESNLIPQQDVIKAQVELSKSIEKLYLLNQIRKSLAIKMNNILNRDSNIEIPKVKQYEMFVFEYSLEDILSKAKSSQQEVVVAGLSVEQAEYETDLARLNYLPDFTFGAEYIDIGAGTTVLPDDGEDAWVGKVAVTMPIWFGRLKAQVNEKKSLLEAAKQNKQDVENRINSQIQETYFKIVAYKDIVNLYETALLPQAEQAFEASQVGFETGEISFLDWLDTERTYLQTRLAYYKATSDYHKSIALLEQTMGQEIGGDDEE